MLIKKRIKSCIIFNKVGLGSILSIGVHCTLYSVQCCRLHNSPHKPAAPIKVEDMADDLRVSLLDSVVKTWARQWDIYLQLG